MPKKRIGVLHAQVPFVKGGAELHVNNLVIQLRKRGYDAELISMPYKWYPEYSLYDSMLSWRLAELSESDAMKIDLLIPTKFPTYGAKHPNKVAWVIHQFRQVYDLYEGPYGYKGLPEGERIRQNVMKYDHITLSECKKIYSNSETVAERTRKYNGLNCEALYHPPNLVGRYYHEEYGDYILSVGRLDKLKRNDVLIRSLQYCDPKIKAKIAGKGPEMEPLKKLALECNVEDRVDFLGFVSDEELLKLYAGAFAVYFAPIDEDYGYITLEAFFSRKPVITSLDAGGVLEFVKDGVNGYVNEVEPEAIGESMEKLFQQKSRCSEFGLEGYEVVKDISWDHVIDSLTESIR